MSSWSGGVESRHAYEPKAAKMHTTDEASRPEAESGGKEHHRRAGVATGPLHQFPRPVNPEGVVAENDAGEGRHTPCVTYQ